MSLDVTFGTSGTGPASPSGLAGAVGAGTPTNDLATLFAALLANTAQASSAPSAKGVTPAASPPTEAPSREPSRRSDDDPPNEDPNQSPAAPDAALTMLLMALTAPPITLKTVLEKPMPPAPPDTSRVGDTPEITKPITLGQTTLGQTNQEAMDTVPVPAPSAPSVKQEDNADGGLLPLSLNSSAPLTAALSVPLPVTSRNSTSSPTAASLPATAVSASVAGVIPTPVTVPGPAPAHVSLLPANTPVVAVPVVTSAPSAPPTMVSFNDIRPDTLNSPGPVSAAAPGLETVLPRLISLPAQNTPAPAASQPAPVSNATVPTPAQAAVLVQTVLQNEPQPANNTGMPTPKANETASKPTEAVHAEGQIPEFVVPLATKLQVQPTQAKVAADALGEAPTNSVSISGTSRRETDGDKPTASSKAPETAWTETAAVLTMPTQTTTAPQSTAATMLTPADRAAVMQQISDGAQQLMQRPAPNGVREINLQLHPHDWGRIKLSVRMTPTVGEDGAVGTSVIAHIVADNPAVKAALETHTAELRQTLQDAGMKLDRLSVTVQAPDAGGQSGTAGQEQQSFTQDSGAWTGQGGAAPDAGTFGADQSGSGSGFGSAFSSQFGDGRGGQTHYQPSQPASVWAEDTETPEKMPAANINTRLPMGGWDSRA